MRGTRITALATLAMLNVFTLAAGVTVARMLPPRLAALHIPIAAARPVVHAGAVLTPAGKTTDPPAGRASATGDNGVNQQLSRWRKHGRRSRHRDS